MTFDTPLGIKMNTLADATPSRAGELREKAMAFEDAAKGYYAEPQTVTAPKFLGAYARARTLYCNISGEALV